MAELVTVADLERNIDTRGATNEYLQTLINACEEHLVSKTGAHDGVIEETHVYSRQDTIIQMRRGVEDIVDIRESYSGVPANTLLAQTAYRLVEPRRIDRIDGNYFARYVQVRFNPTETGNTRTIALMQLVNLELLRNPINKESIGEASIEYGEYLQKRDDIVQMVRDA